MSKTYPQLKPSIVQIIDVKTHERIKDEEGKNNTYYQEAYLHIDKPIPVLFRIYLSTNDANGKLITDVNGNQVSPEPYPAGYYVFNTFESFESRNEFLGIKFGAEQLVPISQALVDLKPMQETLREYEALNKKEYGNQQQQKPAAVSAAS